MPHNGARPNVVNRLYASVALTIISMEVYLFLPFKMPQIKFAQNAITNSDAAMLLFDFCLTFDRLVSAYHQQPGMVNEINCICTNFYSCIMIISCNYI